MSNIAIRVENLGKQYRIGMTPIRYRTLRETLAETINPNAPKNTGRRKKIVSRLRLESSSLSNKCRVSNQEFNFVSIFRILLGAKNSIIPTKMPKTHATLPIQETALKIISLVERCRLDTKKILAKLETSNLKKKNISENTDPATRQVPKSILWP